MNKEEVLKRAIAKAAKHGWKDAPQWDDQMGRAYYADGDGGYQVTSSNDIIFNHQFAMVFWGTESVCKDCSQKAAGKYTGFECDHCSYRETWECHLQEMVLETDPIKYLEGYL